MFTLIREQESAPLPSGALRRWGLGSRSSEAPEKAELGRQWCRRWGAASTCLQPWSLSPLLHCDETTRDHAKEPGAMICGWFRVCDLQTQLRLGRLGRPAEQPPW